MTRAAWAVFVLGAAAMPASAGVITFDPSEAQVYPFDWRYAVIEIDVTVESPAATAILFVLDLEFGAISALDFVFDPGFASRYFFHGVTEYPDGTLQIEGFGFTPDDTVLVGSLTLDMSGYSFGDYRVFAQGEAQDASQTPDPLYGSATITVFPEPGTLVVMGLGVAGFVRRRGHVG